ncbi:hypothetical protein BHE74_00005797 [Ensete ventricosum]|nr:hypothetical protein BHE74_00005797 [Ensete ventricosum]
MQRKVSKTLLRRMKEMLVENWVIRNARGLVLRVCRVGSLLLGSKCEHLVELFIAWEVVAPGLPRLCKDGAATAISISLKRTRNKQRQDV